VVVVEGPNPPASLLLAVDGADRVGRFEWVVGGRGECLVVAPLSLAGDPCAARLLLSAARIVQLCVFGVVGDRALNRPLIELLFEEGRREMARS